MKNKLLNFCLLLSSLIGYLEWGQGQHLFLVQAELEIFRKISTDPLSVLHPFTLIPFFGQLLLLFTVFQREPSKKLTYIGMSCLGILLLFMFIIGIISTNVKIILSTLPFIICSYLILRSARKKV